MSNDEAPKIRRIPTTHYLKAWPVYFNQMITGAKPFDVRLDDRGFQVGDGVVLQEYDPGLVDGATGADGYTGRKCCATITSIFTSGDSRTLFDCALISDHHVVLGLRLDVALGLWLDGR